MVCNVSAPAPVGRAPKLIFQIGAAGTGKSTCMEDCYGEMGVTKGAIVMADGDNVRESHRSESSFLTDQEDTA